MLNELDHFLQQEAQKAEDEFKKSLQHILKEWDEKSYSLMGDFNEILSTAKENFTSSVDRLNRTAQNLQTNLDSLSNSETLSKESNQILKNYVKSYDDFSGNTQKVLSDTSEQITKQILPIIEGSSQDTQKLLSAVNGYGTLAEQRHTNIMEQFGESAGLIHQNLELYTQQAEKIRSVVASTTSLSKQLDQVKDQIEQASSTLAIQIEGIQKQYLDGLKQQQLEMEQLKITVNKTKSVQSFMYFMMFLLWAIMLYFILNP